MALMHISVIPVGTASTSVGDYVAGIERFLRDKGAAHTLGDMGTVVHGSAEELFSLAAEIHNMTFAGGVKRVVTHISIDDRRDKTPKIGEKIESINRRLEGREG
jgi:uncharacterized protein (TIGR00106 family)